MSEGETFCWFLNCRFFLVCHLGLRNCFCYLRKQKAYFHTLLRCLSPLWLSLSVSLPSLSPSARVCVNLCLSVCISVCLSLPSAPVYHNFFTCFILYIPHIVVLPVLLLMFGCKFSICCITYIQSYVVKITTFIKHV